MLYSFGTLDPAMRQSTARLKAIQCPADRRHLWIYLLTPGFTLGYHQHVLQTSDVTLNRHRAIALAEQRSDPSIGAEVFANIASISAEDGLAMALRRGTAHLPYWSRLAICEFRERLGSAVKVAELFRCSPATVTNAMTPGTGRFELFTGERRLCPQQQRPPGQWSSGMRQVW